MADILVRGMEMPQGCEDCKLRYRHQGAYCVDYCFPFHKTVDPWTFGQDRNGDKPDWCPLVPLPAGHGRCIDADDFKAMCLSATKEAKPDFIRHEDWLKSCAITTAFCRDIDEQPTIVPAEGGTDDVQKQ